MNVVQKFCKKTGRSIGTKPDALPADGKSPVAGAGAIRRCFPFQICLTTCPRSKRAFGTDAYLSSEER